jgi:hypothetical protein
MDQSLKTAHWSGVAGNKQHVEVFPWPKEEGAVNPWAWLSCSPHTAFPILSMSAYRAAQTGLAQRRK